MTHTLPPVTTINLDHDQMLILSAGPGEGVRVLHGGTWISGDDRRATQPADVTMAPPTGGSAARADDKAGDRVAARLAATVGTLLQALLRGAQRFVVRQQFGPVGPSAEF